MKFIHLQLAHLVFVGLVATAVLGFNDSSFAEKPFFDEICWQVQSEQRDLGGCGVRIPPLATMIEVNGLVLPLKNMEQLQNGTFPYLLLPKGRHWIRFRPDERAISVTIPTHFRTFYDRLRSEYGLPKSVDEDRLLDACADALDYYSQPFLLTIHGGFYAKEKMRDEAVRKWKRAVRINPTFAPAHLNLAAVSLNSGDKSTGLRELNLAALFNVGDVYGIRAAIENLRAQFDLVDRRDRKAMLLWKAYLPKENLTKKDHRMAAMMGGLSKYAVAAEERAKILNNLAVYFTSTEKPEWACEYFRLGLNELKADKGDNTQIATELMRHMRDACKAAGMRSEGTEYAKVVLRLKR